MTSAAAPNGDDEYMRVVTYVLDLDNIDPRFFTGLSGLPGLPGLPGLQDLNDIINQFAEDTDFQAALDESFEEHEPEDDPLPDYTLSRLKTHECGRQLSTICPVCLEFPKKGDVVYKLRCKHHMHVQCAKGWFAVASTCPVCVAPVLPPGVRGQWVCSPVAGPGSSHSDRRRSDDADVLHDESFQGGNVARAVVVSDGATRRVDDPNVWES